MHYVNAMVAVALLALALLHLDEATLALMFASGAILAAIAFKHWLGTWMVRILAFGTAAALFVYFAQFFILAPTLQPDWYRHSDGSHALELLIAGFAMIPVLSEYSCRMKASGECERGRREFQERKSILSSLRRPQTSRPVS